MSPKKPGSVMADALGWASRIIAVGLVMFLPALGGAWLDTRLGTRFLGIIGLVVGFIAGLTWLARLSPERRRP